MIKFCLGLGVGCILTGSLLFFNPPVNAAQNNPVYDTKIVVNNWDNELGKLAHEGYEAKGIAVTPSGNTHVVMQKRIR